MILRLVVYFVLGGSIISAATYFASVGKGFMAAFVTTVPTTSILTFVFTYLEAGNGGILSYAKALLYFMPAWIIYILTIVFTLERIGIVKSLGLGILVFLALALVTRLVVRHWTG